MKEVICIICGQGTGIKRHDEHILHQMGLECKDCFNKKRGGNKND